MVFVTHNLPLVSAIAARVAVLADGQIAEIGPTSRILTDPESDHAKRMLANMLTLSAVTSSPDQVWRNAARSAGATQSAKRAITTP